MAIAAICGALVAPQVEARGNRPSHSQSGGSQGRGNGGRSGGRANKSSSPGNSNSPHARPGSPGSGNHNGGNRPGSNPGHNSGRPDGNRPGNNGNNGNHNGNHRPGSNPGHNPGRPDGNRPGNNGNHNGNNRPGHNPGNNPGRPGHDFGHGGNRPGHNPGRPGDHRPSYGRPGGPHHFAPPPHRPHYARPWAPPRPPRGWRPGRVYPTFSTVLGITFGSAFDISLAYLLNNGYNVYSYGNNIVYLNNVNQLNLLWPDASLYYGSRGLDRGEFIYSTSYYDTMRYNDAYARLVAAYGAPVSTSYPSNGMQTCWFGNDGRFVTLQFLPTYGADGIMRYYTTLSFGL
mgnify:CR=1 FL=1